MPGGTARRPCLRSSKPPLWLAMHASGVETGMVAVLDELLVRLGGYAIDRDKRAAAGASEFMLLGAWPLIVHRYGALLAGERDGLRLQHAMDARARIRRHENE